MRSLVTVGLGYCVIADFLLVLISRTFDLFQPVFQSSYYIFIYLYIHIHLYTFVVDYTKIDLEKSRLSLLTGNIRRDIQNIGLWELKIHKWYNYSIKIHILFHILITYFQNNLKGYQANWHIDYGFICNKIYFTSNVLLTVLLQRKKQKKVYNSSIYFYNMP